MARDNTFSQSVLPRVLVMWVLLPVALLSTRVLCQTSGLDYLWGLNSAVADGDENLPRRVYQILMAPATAGTNRESDNTLVPRYGSSMAWSPTTSGSPRLAVAAEGAITTLGTSGTRSLYGAVYIYDSNSFTFTLLQTLLPPFTEIGGEPGLVQTSRYGKCVAMSQNSAVSPVRGGTNLFVGQSFVVPLERSDESIYFYSASTETQGLTRTRYELMQTLRLENQQTSQFGSTIAVSPDDTTVVVGAPGKFSFV